MRRWARLALLVATAALMVSHWVALVQTAQGAGMPLLTLQSATLPWETWLVLPVSWLLIVWAACASSACTALLDAQPRVATDGKQGAGCAHVGDACERTQIAQGRNDSGAAPGS